LGHINKNFLDIYDFEDMGLIIFMRDYAKINNLEGVLG